MNILRGGKLHTGDEYYAVGVSYLLGGRCIPTGIVVRQGDNVKFFNNSHSYDVTRRHIIVAAWGEAGVDV
jgi:hypothetical protein